MEYKIKVNITLEDYKSFIFDNIMQKKISLIFSLCLILIGFIITFVDFILTRNYSIYMNIFLFIILFLIILMIKIPGRLSKIYNSDALLHENCLLTITENFIKEESDRGSFSYKTDDFQKVLFGKKVISMNISQQRAIVIPRHCFSSKEEETEIENFIKINYLKINK
nr:YcxB family protein [Treponema socranskii]